jgi:MOSC domain-containing protein YiiM
MRGELLAIFLRPGARQPVRRVERADAVAGHGLTGDHAGGGRRQVTVLALPAWERACRELGVVVDPAVRRANLLVGGLDGPELARCIGGVLHIGDVVIDVLGETRPCELLDGPGRLGLCNALRGERRGGVYGAVRVGGELRIGAPCVGEPAPTGDRRTR